MTVDPGLAPYATPVPPGRYRDPVRRRAEVSASLSAMLGAPLLGVAATDVVAPGLDGRPDVQLRLLQPEQVALPGAVLVWLHGGGFISGDLEVDALISARYAVELGVPVVHVDYRLAPEHPYPAALDDAHAALRWVQGHVAELGVEPERIALAGSSAGGALAAGVVLRARDAGELLPAYVALLHPVLDDRMRTASARTSTDTPAFTTEMVRDMWHHYLGPAAGTDQVSELAAPARAVDLARFPSTYLMVAGLDPLRDEGLEFAERLGAAGTDVILDEWPGAFHGFMNLDADLSRLATRRFLDAVTLALAAGPTPSVADDLHL